jgi:nucleoside-diphosphate-sugar epimerase
MQQAGADSARRVQQQAACPAACIALAAGADWDKRRTAHQMGPAHHGTILVAWVQGPTGRTAQPQHVFTLQIDARLADKAARNGIERFIYASSGSVYGLKDEAQVTEDLTLVPLSEYNKTKMVAERVVLSYAKDMAIQIVRPATVCGLSPRMRLDV